MCANQRPADLPVQPLAALALGPVPHPRPRRARGRGGSGPGRTLFRAIPGASSAGGAGVIGLLEVGKLGLFWPHP